MTTQNNFADRKRAARIFLLLVTIFGLCYFVIQIVERVYVVTDQNESSAWGWIPTDTPFNQDFQYIGNQDEKLVVYSAYFDELRGVGPGGVRILAGLKTYISDPFYCQFYDATGQHYSTTEANISFIEEHWGLPYAASFIMCPIVDYIQLPKFVSVVRSHRKVVDVTNILRIRYADENAEGPVRFAACVQPTYDYDDPFQFLEWIEFHRLMGVRKFTFYNVSMGPKTSCLIDSYNETQVEVLPWSHPYLPEQEIRVHSQPIASNDCIYRYRGVADYVVITDFDELIVPRYGNNYEEFFKGFHRQIKENQDFPMDINAYVFRNAFFFSEWEDDHERPTTENVRLNWIGERLKSMMKTKRTKHLEVHGDRSKFIVVPKLVVEVGAHVVYKTKRRTITLNVPENLAMCHHYRNCLRDYCETRDRTVDRTAQKFATQLTERISLKLLKVGKKCNIDSKKNV